ncbi:hypothetical protein GCM10010166_01400 [Couchioplanes caeruleus subsp. azureus]|uniref:hypothetical protein n=1 Tax=Couchioplanes caeruleus TaxID=56438 RepID=UPI001670F352|nr:hypothetical protein GCM10010166_01400 [Couchioplanes caeruleus subsp. azureus]
MIDRIAHWALDPDGDLYGDERERLRWYEGTAIAASLQWPVVPLVSAVMVWTLGRPAVVPLAVVLVANYLPMLISNSYVQRRRVETMPARWSRKRIAVTAMGVVPYLLFAVGAVYAVVDSAAHVVALIAILVVAAASVLLLGLMTIRRRRREATAVPEAE